MATTNKSLTLPANGADVNTWDSPVNGNFTITDTALGGLTTLNVVSVSGTVSLNSTQYTPCNIVVTGAQTANINYQLPSGVGGFWFVSNQATGAFTITFSSATGGGTTAVVPQGSNATIICDQTNVRIANTIAAGAGGSNTQVQFNSSGALAGSANLTFNSGTGALSVGGALLVGGNLSLTGSLTTDLTVTAGAQTTPVGVTFSATAMTVNCAQSNVFATTFTANVTSAPTLSSPGDGQTINWYITQDSSGSRTMTWPTSFKWPGGTAGVLSTGANAVDLLTASYRAATGNWCATLLKAFA